MKALSIHPYYAIGIVTGDKTIEVRTWETNYRGDIVICSTAKKIHGLIPSHALGVVHLDNIRPMTKSKEDLRAAVLEPKDYHVGQFAWELSNPRIIVPQPVKGRLSLWNYDGKVEFVDLPESWTDEWDAQLTELWKDIIF